MSDLDRYYQITSKDLTKDKALRYGAWASPILFSIIPAILFLVIGLLSFTPASVAFFFFLAVVSLIGGFILGGIISGGLMLYRSKWLANVRERLAIDGIKTEEVRWFMHELKSDEKKALKELEAKNLLLADAFRETLATRLTATRIIKSSKQELLLVKRREGKLKRLTSDTTQVLLEELKSDRENLEKINKEADEMRMEAEARLQMIEAASRRGTNLADTELTLKKLSARSEQLPLALEALKMEEEIRKELETE
ncbi:MAG: hypothetical protein MUC29_06635 [Pyrinomonadaceae bacterium]|jgi:hypothetical protein|nr:hypothetical protein [Pyrinomonadaceae bacterium]